MVTTFNDHMSMSGDFVDVPVSRTAVNHNTADYERFRKHMADTEAKYRAAERKERIKAIQQNLDMWDQQTPSRWRGASLTKIATSEAALILTKIKNGPKGGSVLITGPAGATRTMLAYATVRKMLAQGVATPSQVCILSEDRILSFGNAGFSGRDRLNAALDPQYRLYLIDGAGSKATYTDREAAAYEEILDHIYSRDLITVITSPISIVEFARKFSETFETRIMDLVGDRTITLTDVSDAHPMSDSSSGDQARPVGRFNTMPQDDNLRQPPPREQSNSRFDNFGF